MILDPRELVTGTGGDDENVTRRQLVGRAITDLSGVVTRSVQELDGTVIRWPRHRTSATWPLR